MADEDGAVSSHTLNKYRKRSLEGIEELLKLVEHSLRPAGIQALISSLETSRFTKTIGTEVSGSILRGEVKTEEGALTILESLIKPL